MEPPSAPPPPPTGDAAIKAYLSDQKTDKSGRLVIDNNTLTFKPIGYSLKQICWRIASVFGCGPLALRNICKFIDQQQKPPILSLKELSTLKTKLQTYNKKHCAPKRIAETFINSLSKSKNHAFFMKLGRDKPPISEEDYNLLTHDDLKYQNNGGYTLLHTAALFGNAEAAKKLIAKMQIPDLLLPAMNGSTALHTLASNPEMPLQQFLDKMQYYLYRNEFLSKQDNEGNTALHDAISKNNVTAVDVFLKYMKPKSLEIKNKQDKSARELLSENPAMSGLLRPIDAQMMIRNGEALPTDMLGAFAPADFGKKNDQDKTLLYLAVECNNCPAAKQLVDAMPKESLKAINYFSKKSALHEMLSKMADHKDMPAKELIAKLEPQDVGQGDLYSATPLQYAILAYDEVAKAKPQKPEHKAALKECIGLLLGKMNKEDIAKKGAWFVNSFIELTPLEFVQRKELKDLEALFPK